MDFNEYIKEQLMSGMSALGVEKYALEHGMINLERDGVLKVVQ